MAGGISCCRRSRIASSRDTDTRSRAKTGGQTRVLCAQADDVGVELHLLALQRFDARRRRHQFALQPFGLARKRFAGFLGVATSGWSLAISFLQRPELNRRRRQLGKRLGGNRMAEIGHSVL